MSSSWTDQSPRPSRPATAATALSVSATRPRRAPVYNPYDKFTQPEFDAWIGDITGTLRRALGQAEDDDNAPSSSVDPPQESEEEEVDSEVDDTFAEMQARRAIEKGKARDPREGPGLGARGTGSFDQPIDLGSDSEDEEQEVARMSLMPASETEDSEDDLEEEEYDEEEEAEAEDSGDFLSDIPEERESELSADAQQAGPSTAAKPIQYELLDDEIEEEDEDEAAASWDGDEGDTLRADAGRDDDEQGG